MVPVVHIRDGVVKKPDSGELLYEVPLFEVFRGEIVGLSGESGSGKSLFVRDVWARYESVHYISQDYVDTFSPFIPLRLQISLLIERYRSDLTVEEIASLCGIAGRTLDKKSGDVSGGQLQRAALARALAVSPELIIADELTTAQDAIRKREIIELIYRVRREKHISLIIVSHDGRFLSRVADRRYEIKNGKMKEKQDNEA